MNCLELCEHAPAKEQILRSMLVSKSPSEGHACKKDMYLVAHYPHFSVIYLCTR